MHLNFVLEDPNGTIPDDHPVEFKVIDARGKKRFQKSSIHHVGKIYYFPVPTNDSDPTGNWRAVASIGGASFNKSLKVETVKTKSPKGEY